jgi:transcriptional regulator with XRE-family HTH domain
LQKSIVTPAYHSFLAHLRGARKEAGVTQAVLAERLGETQTFVSKCERGERRLDIVETQTWLTALGVSFVEFAGVISGERSQLG